MTEQDKIDAIKSAIEKQIKNLISGKKTDKIELMVELNVTQGFIASSFLRNNSKETIFKQGNI
jgi:hypothetical protein